MAKSPPEPEPAPVAPPEGYFVWSRDPAVGLYAVLPLWLLYEGLRWSLSPAERNGAEVLLLDGLGLIGARGVRVLSALFLAAVLAALISLRLRQIPWLRVALVSALEGTVYGLLLGPLAAVLATSAHRLLGPLVADERLLPQLVGALGAGIFEELVFRLVLLSMLLWLGLRAARAFGLPRVVGGGAAVMITALVFAGFHHWPTGEPFTADAFLFRTMAGVLLGVIMLLRGYGVVVYTHAMYDVHYYLTH